MSLETSLYRDPSHLIHLLGDSEWLGLQRGVFLRPLLRTMVRAIVIELKMIAIAVISNTC